MSLISDALQKARRESTMKGDRRHGLLSPSHVFQRRSVWPWILTAGSLSLAIGVIVGVLLQGEGEVAAPAQPAVSSPMPLSSPASSPLSTSNQDPPPVQGSQPEPVPVVDQEVQPVASAASEEAGSVPDVSQPMPASEESPPSAAELDAPEAAPTAPIANGPRDGESFLRALPLVDGSEIVLNGIAWSGSGPVALIDGRALEQGEDVRGWKVQLIERQWVELVKDAVTVRVRLK